MYSRNLSGRNADEKYRVNVPPKYSGNRFAQSSVADEKSASGEGEKTGSGEKRAVILPVKERTQRPAIPVKVTVERGISNNDPQYDAIDEEEIKTIPDFELSPGFFTHRTVSPGPDETEISESPGAVAAAADIYAEYKDAESEEVSETYEHTVIGENDEKQEKAKDKEVSRGGFFSTIFGGEKSRFSYEDLLLAGLILLISSSGTKDNEDILIILALLLAYKE